MYCDWNLPKQLQTHYLEAVEANYLSYCKLWNTSFNLSYTQSAPYWKPSKKGGEGGREGGRCQLVFGFWRQLVFGSWFLVLGFWLVESQVKSSSELAKFAIETVFSGWFWHKLGYLVSLCQVATCQLPCQSLRACWWSTTLPRRFSTARPGRFGPRTATSVAQLELCQQHLQALERRHCCWERQFCQEHWWLLKGRMANLSHLETTQAISCSTQRICRSTKWHLRSSLSWANTRWCMRGSSLMPWSMKSRRCRLWRKAASHGWSFALVLRFLGFWLKGFRFLVLGSRVRHGNAMAFQSEPWLGTTGSARP